MPKKQELENPWLTIGQLAEKLGTTVRTLQYYDREGLLHPSKQSEGGRRLYSHKDMIKLHQILSLKSLGFSLSDIKNRLISLDTPADVSKILTQQAEALKENIHQLTETLYAVEALNAEVIHMQTVDFKKYADIIINLQMNNEYYWLIKHFDEDTLDHIRTRFDKETGRQFMDRFNHLNERVLELKRKRRPPEDEQVQALVHEFWNMVLTFTDGDLSLLPKLIEFGNQIADSDHDWLKRQAEINHYLQPAFEIYFQKSGLNPLKGGQE